MLVLALLIHNMPNSSIVWVKLWCDIVSSYTGYIRDIILKKRLIVKAEKTYNCHKRGVKVYKKCSLIYDFPKTSLTAHALFMSAGEIKMFQSWINSTVFVLKSSVCHIIKLRIRRNNANSRRIIALRKNMGFSRRAPVLQLQYLLLTY